MRMTTLLIAVLLSASWLAGCKSNLTSCKQTNKEYAGAPELPPLKAPEGLEVPDTRNALKVPPLNTPERPRGKDEPCLDAPPPFSSSKAPEAPQTPPAK